MKTRSTKEANKLHTRKLTIDKNMHSMASGLNNETGAFASMEKGFG
jgi:hypothetical protein